MVALLQMDQDSTQAIDLPLDDFVSGDLPSVCCKTGMPAEAFVAVEQRHLFRTIVAGSVPVTRARYGEFSSWRGLYRRSYLAFLPLAVVGRVLMALADSIVVSWAVDLALLALLFVATYSNVKARRLLVSPKLNAHDTVTLRGVHPAFVCAVQESLRVIRPAAIDDKP